VVVKDTNVDANNGSFVDWRLSLWGECIDASSQQLHPIPTEHDDDHNATTIAVPVATTSVAPDPEATESLPAKPSDHPDRPVNVKPAETEAQSTPSATTTLTASSTPTHAVSDSFLPSFFPTFGVSKRTQVWIYGAIALIVIFCAGLGAYFVWQRRKRLRREPRDDYEFEMLNDEEEVMMHLQAKATRRSSVILKRATKGLTETLLKGSEGGQKRGSAARNLWSPINQAFTVQRRITGDSIVTGVYST